MAERRPLVIVNNEVTELPTGDTLPGAGGGGSSGPPTFTAKDANYTFVAGDAGLAYAITSNTSRTYTVPNSTFNPGDIIWVANFGTNTGVYINLARGSGVSMYLAGASTNSNKVVAMGGMCILYFQTASRVIVYGNGVG